MDDRGALFPFLSFAMASLTLLVYFAGAHVLFVIPLLFTAFLALMGLIFGQRERPVSSRVSCVMAVVLAATPLAFPFVQDLRIAHLAAKRARETKPLYAKVDETVETLKPLISDYYKQHGVMPDMHGREMLPYVNAQGYLMDRPPSEEIKQPDDPFDPEKLMRWVAVGTKGVMLVSVGQDGVPEMPLPGVAMDGPPMDPLVPMAMSGYDPRVHTYDPTNGGIGLGDVVRWVGREKYQEAMEPLFKAWDKAEPLSTYAPTEKSRPTEPDPDPQSRRDAVAAKKLLDRQEWMAALALSSRGLNERKSFEREWDDAERRLGLIQGMALYNLGAYREAADALALYVGLNPNDAQGHFYLAAAAWLGGDPSVARIHMAAAAQIDPAAPFANQASQLWQEMGAGQTPSQLPTPWIVEQMQKQNQPSAAPPAQNH